LECITAHVDTLAQTIQSCLQSVAVNSHPRSEHLAPPLSLNPELRS
jgi:hypothetical protein